MLSFRANNFIFLGVFAPLRETAFSISFFNNFSRQGAPVPSARATGQAKAQSFKSLNSYFFLAFKHLCGRLFFLPCFVSRLAYNNVLFHCKYTRSIVAGTSPMPLTF